MAEYDPSTIPPPPPTLMEHIEHLEELVQNLKKNAIVSGDPMNPRDTHIANAIIAMHSNISNHLTHMNEVARQSAGGLGETIFSILAIRENELPNDLVPHWSNAEAYWNDFHNNLKNLIVGTDEHFRECCLCSRLRQDGSTIMHRVCSKNPPVEVVRTLLAVIPSTAQNHGLSHYIQQDNAHQFRHLALNNDGHYPIHKLMQHGGSLELVKLLVDADSVKETLTMINKKDSVYHMLIANRNMYQPEAFSEILRYLCCIGIYISQSALLQQAKAHEMKTPVLLLVQSLINKEGLNYQDILRNGDFTFLLKATRYHYISTSNNDMPEIDLDVVRREIEAIPLSEAFLVCAPCFNEKIGDKVLNELLSVDCQFLYEKDSLGQYPVHRMITEENYFMNTITTRLWGSEFLSCILKIVLKHAPRSAQLVNKEGRLPLHIVSDAMERRLEDSDRLDLVKIIWNAYPEAAEAVDSKTGLPPFALAASKEEEGPKRRDSEDSLDRILNMMIPIDASLSSSFFLLRQQPDILSNYTGSGEDTIGSKDTNNTPDAKRTKMENDNDGMQ